MLTIKTLIVAVTALFKRGSMLPGSQSKKESRMC